jgi:predicted dehydrogenase
MGMVHALHLSELASEGVPCTVAALVDVDVERARSFAAGERLKIPVFSDVKEFAAH